MVGVLLAVTGRASRTDLYGLLLAIGVARHGEAERKPEIRPTELPRPGVRGIVVGFQNGSFYPLWLPDLQRRRWRAAKKSSRSALAVPRAGATLTATTPHPRRTYLQS